MSSDRTQMQPISLTDELTRLSRSFAEHWKAQSGTIYDKDYISGLSQVLSQRFQGFAEQLERPSAMEPRSSTSIGQVHAEQWTSPHTVDHKPCESSSSLDLEQCKLIVPGHEYEL